MSILKKYTFYEKDLLTLVRTNVYLSYDQIKENEFKWWKCVCERECVCESVCVQESVCECKRVCLWEWVCERVCVWKSVFVSVRVLSRLVNSNFVYAKLLQQFSLLILLQFYFATKSLTDFVTFSKCNKIAYWFCCIFKVQQNQ